MLANWLKLQTPSMVGVDIGTQEVKAVLLAETAEGYELEAVARVPLPKGAVVDREIRDPAAVAMAMRQIRLDLPKKAKFGAASVSGSTVMTKVIFMDGNLTDEELEAQIEIEADSLIPYPLDDVNIDFEPLRTNEETNQVEILLAACRSDNVDARVDALEEAGLESRVIDVEGYALGRSHKLMADQLPDCGLGKVTAVVDLGASFTTVAMVVDGETVFVREQAFGGEQFTQSILSYYGMGYEEAERAKISGDLPRNYVFEVLGPFQTQFLQQIRRSIQIFANSTNYDDVDGILLCGGGAQVEGMTDTLSTELGVPVQIANPFSGRLHATEEMKQQVGDDVSRYMVACGLALRSFEPWHI